MTMQVLKQAGLYIGEELTPADPSNADGHFEDVQTVALHDDWLAQNNSTWLHTGAPPSVSCLEASRGIRSIANRLSAESRVWGIKDPRASLFLPYWFDNLTAPAGVFTYRHFASCHDSLLRRHGNDLLLNPDSNSNSMRLFSSPSVGLSSWLAYNKAIISQVRRNPESCLLVSQEALLSGYGLVGEINRRFALMLNDKADTLIDHGKVSNCGDVLLPECSPALVAELEATYEELQLLSVAPAAFVPKVKYLGNTHSCTTLNTALNGEAENQEAHLSVEEAIVKLAPLWDQLGIHQARDDSHDINCRADAVDNEKNNVPKGDTAQENLTRPRCAGINTNSLPDFSKPAEIKQAVDMLNSPAEKEHMLKSGLIEQPQNAFVHGLLGKQLFTEKRYRSAYVHLSKAIELQGNDASVHFHLALWYIEHNQVPTAMQSIRQALALRRNADHLSVLIRLHLSASDFKEAQRLSLLGYEWFPKDVRFVLLQADALAGDQQPGAAIDWCLSNDDRMRNAELAKKLYELESGRGDSESANAHYRTAQRRQLKQNLNYRISAKRVLESVTCKYTRAVLTNAWCKSLFEMKRKTQAVPLGMRDCLPRVAMSILVRDEVDIIEANIRFHAAHGVEHFVVTDNASVDGTRELLAALKNEFSMEIIDEPSHTIDQDLWVTRMARQLQLHEKFDWIIHNDADEFWIPGPLSLPEAVRDALENDDKNAEAIGVLACQRKNMLPSDVDVGASGYAFHDNVHAVENTVLLQEGEQPWCNNDSNCVARKVMDKVITRTAGLAAVEYGNHGATHSLSSATCATITVLHFPIRTYEQFERKVVNYGESLARNTRFSSASSLHLRYWYKRYLAGELHEDYRHMTFSQERLNALCDSGHLTVDKRVSDFFKTCTLGPAVAPVQIAA